MLITGLDIKVESKNKTEERPLEIKASITGLSKEHISISREEFLAGKGKIKFHYGELALSNFQAIEVPKFPENFIGNLYLSLVLSAERIYLPKNFYGLLNLDDLQSAKDIKIPEKFNGFIFLRGIPEAEKYELRKKYPGLKIF